MNYKIKKEGKKLYSLMNKTSQTRLISSLRPHLLILFKQGLEKGLISEEDITYSRGDIKSLRRLERVCRTSKEAPL